MFFSMRLSSCAIEEKCCRTLQNTYLLRTIRNPDPDMFMGVMASGLAPGLKGPSANLLIYRNLLK